MSAKSFSHTSIRRRTFLRTWAILLLGSLLPLGVVPDALAADSPNVPISANMVLKLRENVGKQVTVRGRIARTGKSRTGFQFLNFSGDALTAVCEPDDVANFKNGKPADIYRNKVIELTGTVQLRKGKLQILLRTPTQIRIVTDSATLVDSHAPTANRPKGVKLKRIGKDAWLSPGGLRYQGRDPTGLNRVEHIQRHVKDQPTRDGPHGVFDGGSEVTFAVIDEAWKIAHQRRLRPKREGDRSSYTVAMGRRVGFLGGRTGKAKRHPPLTKVFIVFKTGTKEIVTAFPK